MRLGNQGGLRRLYYLEPGGLRQSFVQRICCSSVREGGIDLLFEFATRNASGFTARCVVGTEMEDGVECSIQGLFLRRRGS